MEIKFGVSRCRTIWNTFDGRVVHVLHRVIPQIPEKRGLEARREEGEFSVCARGARARALFLSLFVTISLRIFIKLMKSDRKLKTPREGSK